MNSSQVPVPASDGHPMPNKSRRGSLKNDPINNGHPNTSGSNRRSSEDDSWVWVASPGGCPFRPFWKLDKHGLVLEVENDNIEVPRPRAPHSRRFCCAEHRNELPYEERYKDNELPKVHLPEDAFFATVRSNLPEYSKTIPRARSPIAPTHRIYRPKATFMKPGDGRQADS